MQRSFLFLVFLSALGLTIITQFPSSGTDLKLALDNSMPYIGADHPKSLGYNGKGIIIGIIDTGVDYTHPDLFGLGHDGKIIKAYSFFDNELLDVNGHGTEVAGIIAADGNIQGIAPKAKIISYKVSDNGESVSSDLIIKAIEQAIIDEVDIINISLGVNRTNTKIDLAVNNAVNQGITVVVAAGNDGPEFKTIGSPGINQKVITVGATYNNITASLVATLEISGKQYKVFPMIATLASKIPTITNIMFAEYGREKDFARNDFNGSIVLAERGSNVENEIVYFSDKENNAANANAVALIVYNNEPGSYLGELIHEYNQEDYYPRIPTVSISREDGLRIKNMLDYKTTGTLDIFHNPDVVAHFSSRGPVSVFYIKPDLVAPGIFVNTTLNNGGYNSTSGTSFATPHVSGAAALLLQKNPDLLPNEIKSILVTTTDMIYDAYGTGNVFEDSGSGRLNVSKAFDANLVILPSYLVFNLSLEKVSEQRLVKLEPINTIVGDIEITFDVPDVINMSYQRIDNSILILAELTDKMFGEYRGRIQITDEYTKYNIPVLVKSALGSISVTEDDGKINVQINKPKDWMFAKISVTNSESGKIYTTSAKPNDKNNILVFENGTYWIEVNIKTDGETIDIFEKIQVISASDQHFWNYFDISKRAIIIIAIVIIIIAILGFNFKKI